MGGKDGQLGDSYEEESVRYKQISEIARKPDDNSRFITSVTFEGIQNQPPLYSSRSYLNSSKLNKNWKFLRKIKKKNN